MLPKKVRAKQVTDFRPIANLRLLYKVFAYPVPGRLAHVFDAQHPEEQHGSVQDDRSKSTLYQQIFYWTKRNQLDCQSGLSA